MGRSGPPPPDEPGQEAGLDEALLKGGDTSSEYSLVPLPEVERIDEVEELGGSGWLAASCRLLPRWPGC